jgi:hypothetical protein
MTNPEQCCMNAIGEKRAMITNTVYHAVQRIEMNHRSKFHGNVLRAFLSIGKKERK